MRNEQRKKKTTREHKSVVKTSQKRRTNTQADRSRFVSFVFSHLHKAEIGERGININHSKKACSAVLVVRHMRAHDTLISIFSADAACAGVRVAFPPFFNRFFHTFSNPLYEESTRGKLARLAVGANASNFMWKMRCSYDYN